MWLKVSRRNRRLEDGVRLKFGKKTSNRLGRKEKKSPQSSGFMESGRADVKEEVDGAFDLVALQRWLEETRGRCNLWETNTHCSQLSFGGGRMRIARRATVCGIPDLNDGCAQRKELLL